MAKLTSKRVMQEFNLTRNEFRSQYEVFRRRVAQFNKITGSNYSPLKEFRYSKLYPENATVRTIQRVSSSPKISQSSINISTEYVIGKFKGLENVSVELQKYASDLRAGKITAREYSEKASQVADYLKEKREKYPALAGSEEIISGTYLSNNLVTENEDFVADELF